MKPRISLYLVCLVFDIVSTSAKSTLSPNDVFKADSREPNSIPFDSSDVIQEALSPVIIIPGLGGNKLKAKVDKPSRVHWWCCRKCDYFDIWMNPLEFIPGIIDCWVDNMRLIYDPMTRTTSNPPGVVFKLPQFGRTEAIEWIDTVPIVDHIELGSYFNHIVDALVGHKYIRGENLFGAPYDFRKGPNENVEFFERLIQLTEFAYLTNDDTAITYIAHSMGGRMLLHFLQQMPQTWKDKYVKRVISISVPWGGSVRTVQAISVGYDMGVWFLPRAEMRELQKTYPSIVWLMPSSRFWEPNEVLVLLNGKQYTVENIDQFFTDIGIPDVADMRKDLLPYNNFTAPGVEMHCLYGTNEKGVIESMNFGKSFNSKPAFTRGKGDGTVNLRSLIGCQYWESEKAQGYHTIHQQDYPGLDHYNIMGDSRVIDYILTTLTGHGHVLHRTKRHTTHQKHIMRLRLF